MPEPELTVYRERAYLVAFLARSFYAHWSRDPAEPDWPVVCVHSPTGQMTWHVALADVELFPADLPTWDESDWDGHTTEEKYARLTRLGTGAMPALRLLRDATDRYLTLDSDASADRRAELRRALWNAADGALHDVLFPQAAATPDGGDRTDV